MGSKIEYVDSSQIYATSYVRNSKAIGVLWAIFTICYAIIGVVSFVTPEWIGNVGGDNPGKFGLWSVCFAEDIGEQCRGRVDDLLTMSNIAFQVATIFVALAVLTALLTICAMLLFFFCHSTTVFHICGWMQLVSGELNDRLGDKTPNKKYCYNLASTSTFWYSLRSVLYSAGII